MTNQNYLAAKVPSHGQGANQDRRSRPVETAKSILVLRKSVHPVDGIADVQRLKVGGFGQLQRGTLRLFRLDPSGIYFTVSEQDIPIEENSF